MNWQPIATAPKEDGRDVLVWDGEFASVASWDSCCAGWLVVENIYVTAPTHWMPLPPAPVDAQGHEQDEKSLTRNGETE